MRRRFSFRRGQVHDLHLNATLRANFSWRDAGAYLDRPRIRRHVARKIRSRHNPSVNIAFELTSLLIKRRGRPVVNYAAHLHSLFIFPAFGLHGEIQN